MKQALIRLITGVWSTSIRAGAQTANIALVAPTVAPTAGQVLRANATTPTQLEWGTVSAGDSGTVTSVAISAPTNEFDISGSPVTTSGTLGFTWKSQAAGLFLASPSGAAGAPSFRALSGADITTGTIPYARFPVGNSANTLCAGNDVRLHTQNTDTGTTNTFFGLDTGNAGVRLYNTSGALNVRNAANNAFADIVCNNLTVQGTQTIINSTQVEIGDNIIRLNSDYVGSAPTEDAGFEVNRGTLAVARFVWNETNQRFMAGVSGSERAVPTIVETTLTNASLSGGTFTWTHNLGRRPILWMVYDDTWDSVLIQPNAVNATTISFNFSGLTVANTWTIVAVG